MDIEDPMVFEKERGNPKDEALTSVIVWLKENGHGSHINCFACGILKSCDSAIQIPSEYSDNPMAPILEVWEKWKDKNIPKSALDDLWQAIQQAVERKGGDTNVRLPSG